MTIQSFAFNPLQVNTYVVFDETAEAAIIDPGNSSPIENEQLLAYVNEHKLKVRYIINTHPHIDHIYGNAFCVSEYPDATLLMHKAGMAIYERTADYCIAFGFPPVDCPRPTLVDEGRIISLGNQQWEFLYSPGHCEGSICLYNSVEHVLFSGDVLFKGSIGRSDLPTGNHAILQQSLKRLFSLDADTIVYPGHGPETTFNKEKTENPFLRFLQ